MKKLKIDTQLLKNALKLGERYAVNRGFNKFDLETSSKEKVECLYRLLVNDKLIVPLASDQENVVNMKHKLVLWLKRSLPADHPALKNE